MARKKGYDPEVKAAVIAALLAGQSKGEIAAKYKIPTGTIDAWRDRMRKGKDPALASLASETQAKIGDLLVSFLRSNLQALEAQNKVYADPAWIRQQGAADAALLYGTMTDRGLRLLEAMGDRVAA